MTDSVPGPLVLGGRHFHPMNLVARTFRADAAQTKLIAEIGLDRIELAPDAGEQYADYLIRLQATIVQSGRVADLLGHYLLPSGKTESDWSLAMSTETAKHIDSVQDEAGRRLIWELAAEFVFFYLRSNVLRLATLAKFSTDPGPAAGSEALEVSSMPSSATGRRSSDRWPRATGLVRWPWRRRRSAKA